MKYRNLTEEELIPLKQEFIDFLVVNGIDAQTWESKLKNDPETYAQMISSFSDVVFEKILRSAKHLIRREKQLLSVIDCTTDHLSMITLTTKDPIVDLTQIVDLNAIIDSISMYRGTKKCKDRESEVWQLLHQGYTIDPSALYEEIKNWKDADAS